MDYDPERVPPELFRGMWWATITTIVVVAIILATMELIYGNR